jgi:hypothetical protein
MARGFLYASNGGALLILYTNGPILLQWYLLLRRMVEQSVPITQFLWGNGSFPPLEHVGGCVEWPEGGGMHPMVVLC